MFSLQVCLCTTSIPGAFGWQRRAPDPQTLELQVVVNTMKVLGIEPKTSAGAANTFNHWIISPAPLFIYFFALWIFGPPVEFTVRGNGHLLSYRREGGVRLTEQHWPPAMLANWCLLLFFKNAPILFLFLCVQYFACVYVCISFVCHKRAPNPLFLSYRCLWGVVWTLGTELGFSARTASTLDLNHIFSLSILKNAFITYLPVSMCMFVLFECVYEPAALHV